MLRLLRLLFEGAARPCRRASAAREECSGESVDVCTSSTQSSHRRGRRRPRRTVGPSQIRAHSYASMAPASKKKKVKVFLESRSETRRVCLQRCAFVRSRLRSIQRFNARSLSGKWRESRRRAPRQRAPYCTLARSRLQRISPKSPGNSPTNFRNVQPVETVGKDSAGSPTRRRVAHAARGAGACF